MCLVQRTRRQFLPQSHNLAVRVATFSRLRLLICKALARTLTQKANYELIQVVMGLDKGTAISFLHKNLLGYFESKGASSVSCLS
jgi:hypothetical protein